MLLQKKNAILNFLTQGAARALHVQPLLVFITKDKTMRAIIKESPSASVFDSIGPIELDLALQNFQLDGHMHALKLFKINKWVNAIL